MRCLLLWRRRRFTIFMMVEKAFQGRTVIDVKLYLRSMALSELLMFYRFWTMKDLWVEVPFYPLALLWLFALFASKMHSSPKLLKPYSFSVWQMEIMDLHPNTLLTCKNVSMMRMIVMSLCGQCVKSDLSKRECDANDNLDLRPGSSS